MESLGLLGTALGFTINFLKVLNWKSRDITTGTLYSHRVVHLEGDEEASMHATQITHRWYYVVNLCYSTSDLVSDVHFTAKSKSAAPF